MEVFNFIMAIVFASIKIPNVCSWDRLLRSQDSKRTVLICASFIADPHYWYVESKHVTRMSDSFHSRRKLIL